MTSGREQRDALESALGRLPVAVVVVDAGETLRPLNERAQELFRIEGLAGDLPAARPSHPLARLIAGISSGDLTTEPAVLQFPSGARYTVEASRRSEKGKGRWMLLLISVAPETRGLDTRLDEWKLTQREREVVHLMVEGLSSAQICLQLSISENTLKSHVKQILEKSGSESRSAFLAKLVRQ